MTKCTNEPSKGLVLPKYVGRWWLPCKSVVFNATKKPSWIHRKLTELILGWTWEDIK